MKKLVPILACITLLGSAIASLGYCDYPTDGVPSPGGTCEHSLFTNTCTSDTAQDGKCTLSLGQGQTTYSDCKVDKDGTETLYGYYNNNGGPYCLVKTDCSKDATGTTAHIKNPEYKTQC